MGGVYLAPERRYWRVAAAAATAHLYASALPLPP